MTPLAEPAPNRPTTNQILALCGLGLLIALAEWWPMFVTGGGPTGDGRWFYHQVEIAKAALRVYGEWPFWNPFDCAGIAEWDHPEAIIGSPLVLLMSPASTTATLFLWQISHVAVGFVGMWLLLHWDLRVSRAAAFVGAWIFASGAWNAGQSAGLHATMMSFLYMPLLLLLWRRAERSLPSAVGAGMLVALMVYDGATYPLPFCLLLLAVETATRMWPLRRVPNLVTRALVAGVTGVGLSGVRLLPLVDRLGQGARGLVEVDALARPQSLWRMFTWREADTARYFEPQEYQWHEYIAYLGIVGAALALIGLVFAVREARWTVIVATVAFVLMLGKFAEWAPWSLLRAHVYPFHETRVPSRFRHLLVAFLCIWIALAIDRTPAWIARIRPNLERPFYWTLLGLASFSAIDSMLLGSEIVKRHYTGDPPVPVAVPSPRFYYGGDGLTPDWMNQPSQNRAYTGCRASFSFRHEAPIWTGDVPQVRAADDGATILSSSRTHNTFDFEVVADGPRRVLLNTAYDRGWHASVGEVKEHSQLLSVDVPGGRHNVHVRYRPTLLLHGLVLTVTTAIAVMAFFWLRRWRGGAYASSTL